MTPRTTTPQRRRARSAVAGTAEYRVEAGGRDTARRTDPSSPDFDAAAWLRAITRG